MSNQLSKGQWWREAVIYQIYPRSFCDLLGKGIGNLVGITSKLKEIKSLGVNTIWISPFFKSPMKDFGYDVEDHCAVDPIFGSLEDAKDLIDQAHILEIRVLIDLVISHTSDQHSWFKESRSSRDNDKSDYYVWAEPLPDGSPPNNWLSIFGGSAWQWDTRRCQYYLHNFLSSQPDLNFHHPQVIKETLTIAEFWLKVGVDGFRLDTVNFYYHDRQLRSNPPAQVRDQMSAHETNPYGWQNHTFDKNQPEVVQFIEKFRALLDRYGSCIGLGEIGESPIRSLDLLIEYTAPQRLHLCYSFDLLSQFGDAPYWRNVIQNFEQKRQVSGVDSWPCWAFSNHDVIRAATRLCPEGGNIKLNGSLLFALLLSLRGTPCIYQGEELSLPEAEIPFESLVDPYGIEFWPVYKGRDGCRTPYPWQDKEGAGFSESNPWLPIDSAHLPLAFTEQDQDPHSTLQICRQLLTMRTKHPELRYGDIRLLDSDPQILIFERSLNDQDHQEGIICIFNPTINPHFWTPPDTIKLGRCILSSHQDHMVLAPQSWAFFKKI
jgi:alpha-glucosidase